jgi:hypothetical protein
MIECVRGLEEELQPGVCLFTETPQTGVCGLRKNYFSEVALKIVVLRMESREIFCPDACPLLM